MTRSVSAVGAMLLMLCAAFAQGPTRAPAFEVATIKPAVPRTGGGRASTSGDRNVYGNTTLLNVMVRAFRLKSPDQVAGPAWVFENRYDIVAKAPENTSNEQRLAMLQTLLIERFKLVLHHETRDLACYALVQGGGKLKLVEDASGQNDSMATNDGRREFKSMSMAALAQFVSPMLRRPVMDRTGLVGHYRFPLDPTREETGQESAPSIFTVVGELGLKLESRSEPFDVIVITGGEKVPIEN